MTAIDEDPVDKKSSNITSNIFDADVDFDEVAKYIDDSWFNKPHITQVYITKTEFGLLVGRDGSVLDPCFSSVDTSPDITNKLNNFDVDKWHLHYNGDIRKISLHI